MGHDKPRYNWDLTPNDRKFLIHLRINPDNEVLTHAERQLRRANDNQQPPREAD